MNESNLIGTRIKERRISLGISQQELAESIGYADKSSINKIESNARNLTQSKIKPIADALQTTPDYLMGWSDDPEKGALQSNIATILYNKLDNVERDLLTNFRLLDEVDRAKILERIETLLESDKYEKDGG